MAEGAPTSSLWGRCLVIVAVVAAVASPAVRARDSYPLSTYPVYATARARVGVLHTAIGVDAEGRWTRLSLPVVADSDDPLIAEARVADAVRDDRADMLCTDIATRARQSGWASATPSQGRRGPIVAIEVVTERLDLVATATEQAPPLDRRVHARCPVSP